MFEKKIRDNFIQKRDELRVKEQCLDNEELLVDREWTKISQKIKMLEERRQNAGTTDPIEAKEEAYKKKIFKYSHNFTFIVCLVLLLLCVSAITFVVMQWKVSEKRRQTRLDIESAQKQVSDIENQIEEEQQRKEQQKEAIQAEIQERNDEIQLLQAKILNYKKNGQSLSEQEEILLTDSNRKKVKEQIQSLKKKSLDQWEEFYYDGNLYYRFQQISNMGFYGNGDGNTNVIYPGAVIRGDSLFLNDYTLVPTKRSGMTLTCNGLSTSVEEMNYAEVSKCLKRFEDTAETYQKSDYYMQTVKTGEEIDSSIGVSAGVKAAGVGGTASSSISKSFQQDKTNILVVVRQKAYTVTAEPLEDGVSYFADGADVNMLGEYAPAYISEVTYGRSVVMLVSSEESEETLKEALSCGVDDIQIPQAANAKVSAEVKQEYSKTLSKLKVEFTIDINGGNADTEAFATMTVADCMEKFGEVLKEGEETVQNPVPISYELRYLADNSKVPCANIVDSWEVPADTVDVLELSWDRTYPGIFGGEVDDGEMRVAGTGHGIDSGVVVLLPDNVISVKQGENIGSVLVVAPVKKDRTIKINILKEKEKLLGGTKTDIHSEMVSLDDIGQLEKCGISVKNVVK